MRKILIIITTMFFSLFIFGMKETKKDIYNIKTKLNDNREIVRNEIESGKDTKTSSYNSEEEKTLYQTGVASFYGGKWHGKRTANGEIFDTHSLTAAHKTLPFNTKVKVTNLSNGKSVIVRINNRGPYSKGRVIDLSTAAFSAIENTSKGITKVQLQIVK
ncbi:MAG: septal ring lytic transglycosylase RlpA family protein [Leptotrichiaceae bacterium]|jgi:rare lipoprotein A|nr:septal ring lytic transglycosylase RlpA family protein [Leptotrichiaceae bacterium]MBP6280615.1 septal ring lytic transglycosylase RlpA family protein [Leptotrichiaceae bacterium]MBP7100118.1 septal ring lytic transglycosylase RlpA family protein [Leptotrichiaceae bacterium]MBP7725114.1 septal ring lytic transglycosylase RlpA family protein [Leptotrichiaceae bacterium]MBP9629203.1 septal ring lytic transglycosylase RlpA family protein [Leptotrichiaceae bacterium]